MEPGNKPLPEPMLSQIYVSIRCRQATMSFDYLIEVKLQKQPFDGLVQERLNSIANALELCLSCTKPLSCSHRHYNLVLINQGSAPLAQNNKFPILLNLKT